MLLFIAWFLIAFCNYGWVASVLIAVSSCDTGYELQQRISNISNALSHNETFADVGLKVVVLNMNESIEMAPPQLITIFKELKDAVYRYAALATELNSNAADALSRSTKQLITIDNRIVDAINRGPASSNDKTKLAAACALIDRFQDATRNFTESITKRYQDVKLSVMPNEVEIIGEIAELTRNEATIIDFDASAGRVRELIQKIEAASDCLEMNIKPQKIEFRHTIDKLAFDVERKLQTLADGLYKLFPDSLNLFSDPQCDSPENLRKRLYKMAENLSDIPCDEDYVPNEIRGNLQSCIWSASGQLKIKLSYLLFATIKYDLLVDTIFRNASTTIDLVTTQKIENDFTLVSIVNGYQDMLNETKLLDEACQLTDIVRNITAQYRVDVLQLVAQLVDTLIPNRDHLNRNLISLPTQLKFSRTGDVEKIKEKLLKMSDEVQEANKNIEANTREQMDEFEKRLTELALNMDARLKSLAEKLKVLLQLPVNDDFDGGSPK